MDKIFISLLLILFFLLGLIGLAAVIEPVSGLTGVAHPDFKGMKISPDNTDLHNHTKWIGYLFALGLIALFTNILVIGHRKAEKNTGMFKGLVAFGVIYAIIFSLMIFSNWSYVLDGSHEFFWQMPQPTAWMIYAVWLAPLMVTALYVLNFEKWVISPEEEAELKTFINLEQF